MISKHALLSAQTLAQLTSNDISKDFVLSFSDGDHEHCQIHPTTDLTLLEERLGNLKQDFNRSVGMTVG